MTEQGVFPVPPVGVTLGGAGAAGVAVYRGVSYCDAVRRAGEGEALLVEPGSIQVCGWSPVILGLQQPRTRFEKRLAPCLPFPGRGLLLAPLGWYEAHDAEPDLVILRARPEMLAQMVARAGPGALWAGHGRRLDRSAAFLFADGRQPRRPRRVAVVNQVLAALAPRPGWQAFSRWLFRFPAVTAGYDALIAASLADMSVCRNSTAVPLLTGLANISYFCTGGITWGGNHPGQMTSGWPYGVFRPLAAGLKGERVRHRAAAEDGVYG